MRFLTIYVTLQSQILLGKIMKDNENKLNAIDTKHGHKIITNKNCFSLNLFLYLMKITGKLSCSHQKQQCMNFYIGKE